MGQRQAMSATRLLLHFMGRYRLVERMGYVKTQRIRCCSYKYLRVETIEKMTKIMNKYDSINLLESEISKNKDHIKNEMSKYQKESLFHLWMETIRGVEELINVMKFGIHDCNLKEYLLKIKIDKNYLSNPTEVFLIICRYISPLFGKNTAVRINKTIIQIAAIKNSFDQHNISKYRPTFKLETLSDVVDYLQSRRRHYLALLYMIPDLCTGNEIPDDQCILVDFATLVELNGMSITSSYLNLAMSDIYDDFQIEIIDDVFKSNCWLETLDVDFSDPERLSIIAMEDLRADQIANAETEAVPAKAIFSASELRNFVKKIAATYDAFGLKDSYFLEIQNIILELSLYIKDDYYIEIKKDDILKIFSKQHYIKTTDLMHMFVAQNNDEYENSINEFRPFIDIEGVLFSNENMVIRFLYNFKNKHLESRKRYQIHSGFIFEDIVKKQLENMGFDIKDIKRINRKEFDVVSVKNNKIYNFQCKNNFIDISKISEDRKLYVRYNKKLISYYAKSLKKEKEREGLLISKIGIPDITHFIITRFPVISKNESIINYNELGVKIPDLG